MVKGPQKPARFFLARQYFRHLPFMESIKAANEAWKTMTDEEKAPFKLMEKEHKAKMRTEAGDKYRKTSDGKNLQEVDSFLFK